MNPRVELPLLLSPCTREQRNRDEPMLWGSTHPDKASSGASWPPPTTPILFAPLLTCTSLEAQKVKNPPANAGDWGSIPGWGRSPREGNGCPLQYSRLENSMDRGAWWGPFYGITKSWTQLSDSCFRFHSLAHACRDLLIACTAKIPRAASMFRIFRRGDIVEKHFGGAGQPLSIDMTWRWWVWREVQFRKLWSQDWLSSQNVRDFPWFASIFPWFPFYSSQSPWSTHFSPGFPERHPFLLRHYPQLVLRHSTMAPLCIT